MKIQAISGWRDPRVNARIAPPEAEYDAWIKSRNLERNRGGKCFIDGITARKLRRVVVMRRQGETWKDCGRAVGVEASTARGWCAFLPLELQP